MIDVVIAYIGGCNKEQIAELSKHIIERQTILLQNRELELNLLRQNEIKEV